MRTRSIFRSLATLLLFAFPVACSNSKGTGQETGGAPANSGTGGGVASSGGVLGSGGSPASGGTIGSGGATPVPSGTGGKLGNGGTMASGGRTGKGGTTEAGGATTDAGPPVSSTGCGAALPAACNNTTTGPCTLDVNGKTRQYFVVLPTGYDNSKPAAIVFAFHGLGGTASSLLPTGSRYGGGYALYGRSEEHTSELQSR